MTTFNITTLKLTAGTQFRTEMSVTQVEGLQDLIGRNVQWKTPIQIATYDGLNFLTDGFHRVEAYGALGITEIPAGQFEVIACESMNEVIMLSMRANAAHGQQNSTEDRVLMMNKLIEMDEARFMNGPWEVATKEVAEALMITINQARTAVGPKNDELKDRRNASIMEMYKGGKSNKAIGKALGMSHTNVGNIIARLTGGASNVETTFSAPAVLPMANTQDRSDTRVDADEFVDSFLEDYADFISLAEDETETEPKPAFDLKAATGFGDDITHYTKREEKQDEAPWTTDEETDAKTLAFDALKGLTKDEAIEVCRLFLAPHGITLSK